jgi:hypothetical protein
MRICSAVVLCGVLAGCSVGADLPEGQPEFAFDFAQGPQGWSGGFADYPVGQESSFELVADSRALPAELGSEHSALFISGNNHSDDLFMFYKRRVDGLLPNRVYHVRFGVQIATEAPHDCVGIGGAPGEGVTLKAGASTIEPVAIGHDGFNEMNVDKGTQADGGANALVLGNIANQRPCDNTPPVFELKSFDSGADSLDVTTDAGGAAWVFVGTDSGFEGTTNLYYTRFSARFSE